MLMKKSLLTLALVLVGRLLAFADGSDVLAFYVETDRAEAVSRYDHLEFDGRYFVKTSLDKGIYEIKNAEYRFNDVRLFVRFRYSPFLYKYDKGFVKISNSFDAGQFYKK